MRDMIPSTDLGNPAEFSVHKGVTLKEHLFDKNVSLIRANGDC